MRDLAILIKAAIAVCLCAVVAGLASGSAAQVPPGMPCHDTKGALDRITADDPAVIVLPDIVLTSESKIIRFANGDKQTYGFVQVGACAVPKVFWLGPYIPTAEV